MLVYMVGEAHWPRTAMVEIVFRLAVQYEWFTSQIKVIQLQAQSMDQRVCRGIAILFRDRGTRRR